MTRKYFCQNYLFHSSKEVFLHNFGQFLESWIFDVISTVADLRKMVKILYYLKMCYESVFCQYYLFPSLKKVFLHNLRQIFGKLIFWWNIDRCWPNKNGENFVLSQNVLRNFFLSKLFVPLIKGNVSPQFQVIFGRLNFWRNTDRRRPNKNSENLTLYQKVPRKYFLSELFVPLIKGSASPQLKTIFGKLNFWQNIDRRWPNKNDENFVLS